MTNATAIAGEQRNRLAASTVEVGAGAALLVVAALIHLYEAPEYWGEVRYIGALFVVGAVGALASVLGILRRERWGWQLGLVVAGAMAVAYVLSRSVGIPQFREASLDKFLEPFGVGSLVVEALFVLLALRELGRKTAVLAAGRR